MLPQTCVAIAAPAQICHPLPAQVQLADYKMSEVIWKPGGNTGILTFPSSGEDTVSEDISREHSKS